MSGLMGTVAQGVASHMHLACFEEQPPQAFLTNHECACRHGARNRQCHCTQDH